MQRVKKGEKYWSIGEWGDILTYYEEYAPTDDWLFQYGNYFATEEEAESMAEKLRAVLKGADVIEMPSEDNMLGEIPIIDDPCDYIGPGRRLGWGECYNWFKSKIVK